MPESLSTMDGERLDVDQSEAQFAAAMAAPAADRPGKAAPPRKPPEPAPDPVAAPHGWTFVDGEWRPKKAPGRPRTPAGDKPRVSETPPATSPTSKPEKPAGRPDFRGALREAAEALWFVLASTPVPAQAFGVQLGGFRTRIRVQAALIASNVDALAAGINTIGQHNRVVAQALGRLAAGEAGLWVLPTVMMLAPVVAQTGQLWTGQLADQASLDAIAAKTEADAVEYVERLAQAATAAAAQAGAS